ncbi:MULTISPECIES: serine/threonine-protein kinase [Trichocoleus]|uniref:Serine/threonine protein kinase n=1 Tax=Trichocoleus desertorum GB2-A4 TaxID=2933944 RepID=A0ABV0J3Q1_9CYAN|nr:serine/threonine-protein kinase [Trichocoleus sp. FACHB-46]MBD1861761.1 serine/threonine protein kinase [Trichocoleus sp. FACHB-46]
MSYCLNPVCRNPENTGDVEKCLACGTPLRLKERYRAIEPIGQGGFGKTFLAIDEDLPSKPHCVIKQFFPQSSQSFSKAEELFRREAEQLEQLGKRHLQIPELFAFFELGSGLYFVQEFVDGQDLDQELKNVGKLDEAKIWCLLEELLCILKFIHSNRVIHRDIKSANIIRRSTDHKLVLVDFGISKLASETGIEVTGTVIGSRGYAAPEQEEGKGYFSSDLFGLAATCFYLLTSVQPSKVLSQWGNWQKNLKNHLKRNNISDDLRDLLVRLLQRTPSQRYQSADEVIELLNSIRPQITVAPTLPVFTIADRKINEIWPCEKTLTSHSSTVLSVAISPDGQVLASGSGVDDMLVKIWELSTGKPIRSLFGHTSGVQFVTISSDGQTLVSASSDKVIKVWDLVTKHLRHTITEDSNWFWSVTTNSSAEILAVGHENGANLWDLTAGKLLGTLVSQDRFSDDYSIDGPIFSVAISLDNQIVVGGSHDGKIKLWELSTGNLLDVISTGHEGLVKPLIFSPNEHILASSGSDDSTIKVWDLKNHELVHTCNGHTDRIRALAFSPDGHTLASASSDETVGLWDMKTGEKLLSLEGHSGPVLSVTFSPDSQTLVTGGQDKTIKIWQRACIL